MEPYDPQTLPIETIDWIRHVPLIGKANRALARYDGLLQGIVHPEILLSPLTMREAVPSSRIEGTQASLEEVLSSRPKPERNMRPRNRRTSRRSSTTGSP